MKKLNYLVPVIVATLVMSCGGENEELNEETNSEVAEEVVVLKPDPITTQSGNAVTVIDGMGDLESSNGNSYEINYSIVEFTTNVLVDDLPIDEYSEPGEDQQLLHIVVEAEMLNLKNLNWKTPPDGFHLMIDEEEIDEQSFTRFSDEFNEGLLWGDLKVSEVGKMELYYKIPLESDLSNAYLSLYLGSDTEPGIIKLFTE